MSEQSADARPQELVRFDYIKSNFHRVVHVDGVVGGPNAYGNIVLSFWSERFPIPQQVAHAIAATEHGTASLGAEVLSERVTRKAAVREVDVSAVLSPTIAKALRDWLDTHIKLLENTTTAKA